MCAGKAHFNMADENPAGTRKNLPPAAQRALAEAEERRKKANRGTQPREIGGPKGEEPTRYGDWEKGGRAVDF